MADTGRQGHFSTPANEAALAELSAICDIAVSLQPETESVMRACLADGPKNATLAREAGRLISELTDLVGRTDAIAASGIVDETGDLLRYHQRLLAETVGYAFSVSGILDRRSLAFFSDHLGEPAVRLRRLRDLLASNLGDRIASESSRLVRAVDNILNLAAMGAGTLRPDFASCDPSAVLQAAVAAIDPELSPGDRLDVTVALPGIWAPHGLIWADARLLTQAVTNAIDNALRHNPPTTRVSVTVGADGDCLSISIADDGWGLPADVATAIDRAAATGVFPTEIGTGIATTMGLVSAHGGTVSYPGAGDGTCCVIRLAVRVPR